MNKKRWFAGALFFLFVGALTGYAGATTTTASTPAQYIVAGDPNGIPSNVIVSENFGEILTHGFQIQAGVDAGAVTWNYQNVWIADPVLHQGGFDALFPQGPAQDANLNGVPDIRDLAKALDPNTPNTYAGGQPIAVASSGFNSPFDVVIDGINGDELNVSVIKSSAMGSPGVMTVPMNFAKFFSVDARGLKNLVDTTADLDAIIGGGAVTAERVKIATIIGTNNMVGGIGAGSVVSVQFFENDKVVQVKLDMRAPAGSQLYVIVEVVATDIAELEPFLGSQYFRPAVVPLPDGLYVVLAYTPSTGYLETAQDDFYGIAGVVPNEVAFNIGLNGLGGNTLKISSAYKAADAPLSSLTLIQSIELQVVL